MLLIKRLYALEQAYLEVIGAFKDAFLISVLMVIKTVLLPNLILILFKLDTLQITLSLNLLPLTELNALIMHGTLLLNTLKVYTEEPIIPVVKWRKMLTETLNFIVIKPTIITNNTTNCFGINI